MKQTEWSILSWGIYIVLLGLCFMMAPMRTVGLFGYAPAEDFWVRMLGLLSVVLGGYYLLVYRYRLQVLYAWKIAGHTFGSLFMLLLLFLKLADSRLLATLVIELAAAAWTALALRHDLRAKRK